MRTASVECPSCAAPLRLSEALASVKRLQCPKCSASFSPPPLVELSKQQKASASGAARRNVGNSSAATSWDEEELLLREAATTGGRGRQWWIAGGGGLALSAALLIAAWLSGWFGDSKPDFPPTEPPRLGITPEPRSRTITGTIATWHIELPEGEIPSPGIRTILPTNQPSQVVVLQHGIGREGARAWIWDPTGRSDPYSRDDWSRTSRVSLSPNRDQLLIAYSLEVPLPAPELQPPGGGPPAVRPLGEVRAPDMPPPVVQPVQERARTRVISLWDLNERRELRRVETLRAHHAYFLSGSTVVALLRNHPMPNFTAMVLDAETLQQRHHFSISAAPFPVTPAVEGGMIAVCESARQISLYDAMAGKECHRFEADSDVTSLALDSTRNILAAGSSDGKVYLWDLATNEKLGSVRRHETAVSAVAFSPDGALLAVASQHSIKLIHVQHLNERATVLTHPFRLTAVAFSPDGKTLYAGYQDNTVKAVNIREVSE